MCPAGGNNLGDELANEFPVCGRQHLTCGSLCVAEELSTAGMILLGKDSGDVGPDFLWASPHEAFLFPGYCLDPFSEINLRHKYNNVLSPVSPPGKLSNLEVVAGPLPASLRWWWAGGTL